MKLNRDKYLLARANACVSIKDDGAGTVSGMA